MALQSLYRVCEIKKLDLIFSSFSVKSQNHSYKNSIVFRLARHLCSSISLVYVCMYVCVRMYICMYVCVVAMWCSGCVLGSGPEIPSSSPTQAIFHPYIHTHIHTHKQTNSLAALGVMAPPSASHQPHQSTQLWLGTWHLLGCKFKAFLMKQQWSRWDFGCPHHLLWGKVCSPASS